MTMSTPTLEEWLAMPRTEIAAQVAEQHLGVMFSIDGTQRHYLLRTGRKEITDFADYCEHNANSCVRVVELLFGLGAETVMTPLLYAPNFVRGDNYLSQSLKMSRLLLTTAPFTKLYERWHVKVRLYGDYDLAPNAAPVRQELVDIFTTLKTLTPTGERLLLFGFCAGSFSQEMITRTAALYQATGRMPSEEEVRLACFPDGPKQLDVRINAGLLRVGLTVPPLLDGGKTDYYNLVHLPLDIHEDSLRRILYDHLFRRWFWPDDDAVYSPEGLQALNEFYEEHQHCVVGLGKLVGPGLWYADHVHVEAPVQANPLA